MMVRRVTLGYFNLKFEQYKAMMIQMAGAHRRFVSHDDALHIGRLALLWAMAKCVPDKGSLSTLLHHRYEFMLREQVASEIDFLVHERPLPDPSVFQPSSEDRWMTEQVDVTDLIENCCTPKEARAVRLVFLESRSTRNASKELGISHNRVHKLANRGLKKIRAWYVPETRRCIRRLDEALTSASCREFPQCSQDRA